MERIDEVWPDQAANSIAIVIDTAGSDPLSEANLRVQHAYLSDLLNDTRVNGGIGVGLPSAGMSADDVVQYWSAPSEFLSSSQNDTRESLRKALVGDNATMMSVQLKGVQTNVDSRMVVEDIRDERDEFLGEFGGDDDRLLVAGFAAYNADNLDAIAEEIGLDVADFRRDMASPQAQQAMAAMATISRRAAWWSLPTSLRSSTSTKRTMTTCSDSVICILSQIVGFIPQCRQCK